MALQPKLDSCSLLPAFCIALDALKMMKLVKRTATFSLQAPQHLLWEARLDLRLSAISNVDCIEHRVLKAGIQVRSE